MWPSLSGQSMKATASMAYRFLGMCGLDRKARGGSVEVMARKAGPPTSRDGGGGRQPMCGICGFTGPGDEAVLDRMMRRLEHRGPDEEGCHLEPGIHLGARRLRVIHPPRRHP